MTPGKRYRYFYSVRFKFPTFDQSNKKNNFSLLKKHAKL